jgi:predicted ferric reductase
MTSYGDSRQRVRTARRPDRPVGGPSRPVRVPLPRSWPIRTFDIGWVILGNVALILAMWLRHGGLDELSTIGGTLTAIGQLTGLFAAYGALVQLVLMSRSPWMDQVFGMDRLAWMHKWLGFSTIWLIVAHGAFTIVGYAMGDHVSILHETWTILTTFDFVALSVVGFALFALIGVTSVRAARERLSYESWFLIHLLAYVAIALGFLHQLSVGSDFMHDAVARVYWIGLLVATVLLILVFRFGGPIVLNLRHRLSVLQVVDEGPGLFSIYVGGHDLDRLAVRSGQWFIWRFLTGSRWWSGHPFSLSSAPNGLWLRITVKALGDDTRALRRLQPGTRVWVEGPYGILTGAKRTRPKVALIAGGIGIAPLRALLEALPAAPGDMTLVYRARHPKHLALREEIDELARLRGARVHYVVGRRGTGEMPYDPLDADHLERLVPDIHERDVYVCGPTPMMRRLEAALDELAVPSAQVHTEQFAY